MSYYKPEGICLDIRNSDEAYAQVLRDLIESGGEVKAGDSKSTGANKASNEFLAYSLRINSPRERLVYNPNRRINLPPAVARFVWMMAGSDRLQDIAFYEEKVRSFSDDEVSVPGSDYGHRIIQPYPGFNQLTAIIDRLRNDASTRRAAVSIYHPEDAIRDSRDIPCAFGLFYHIRDGHLQATVIMRSNNAFILLPYNLFEFSLLAEVVAAEVGVPLGSLTYFAASMHLYEQDFDKAQKVVKTFDHGFVVGQQMAQVPADSSPVEQIRRLVILESELRHASAGVGMNNLENWLERGRAGLNAYWQQFFYLLLLHVVSKNNDQAALSALKEVIEEPYRAYLTNTAFVAKSAQPTTAQQTLFPLTPSSNSHVTKVVPILSTRRFRSLEARAHEWSKSTGQDLHWTQYSRLQHHFMGQVAARDHDLEITSEEFLEAVASI